jgi:hypothetical protein
VKKPFYIIQHNPNLIGSAEEKGTAVWALTQGANALGPDVVFRKNDLWVLHNNNPADRDENKPRLHEYLTDLADVLLRNPEFRLLLIAFDLKNTVDSPFDFSVMQKIISECFSSRVHGVKMLFTTPNDFDFLINSAGPHLLPGQAIGVDEFDNPEESDARFRAAGFPYIYGAGNSTFFNSLKKPISRAIQMRNTGNSFGFVFPWVIDFKHSLRRYLNMDVDAIMTNEPARLKRLIEKEYSGLYDLNAELPLLKKLPAGS